jgi:ubiquinone/menaquinone biosynthesis C-methylase UbiE
VRCRTFQRFVDVVLETRIREMAPTPITVLDVGAGNGWLSYRVAQKGQRATALDIRTDSVDGLRAGDPYRRRLPTMFRRVAASFEAIPLADRTFDLAVFNASLHYALDLERAFREITRVVVPGGRVAILDSPFYRAAEAGAAMVEQKSREARERFGDLAEDLTGPPFIEYLTRDGLEEASREFGLVWRRHRVRYPLWYEMRPFKARLEGRRPPSRFDLWETTVR